MRSKKQLQEIFMIIGVMLLTSINMHAQGTFYGIKVGDVKVTALSDGSVDIDVDQLFEPKGDIKASDLIHNAYLHNPVEVSINVYLIQYDDKNILVDTGAGQIFGDHAGNLTKSLNQYGLTPEEITDILITHIHVDHIGGLVMDNKIVYPNALVHVNEVEFEYWMQKMNSDKARSTLAQEQRKIVENVQKVVSVYIESNQIVTFKNTIGQLLPHIEVLPTIGHTPGHTVFVLNSDEQRMYFWGDLVHVASVQFIDPYMINHFDEDTQLAKEVRNTFYDKMVDKEYLIGGAHQSFPGIGRIQKVGQHYQWIAVPFSVSGRTK